METVYVDDSIGHGVDPCVVGYGSENRSFDGADGSIEDGCDVQSCI